MVLLSGSSDDIDRYVTYNYLENVWSIGELSRTAWLDEGIFDNPCNRRFRNSSILYNHETGSDADGVRWTMSLLNPVISILTKVSNLVL